MFIVGPSYYVVHFDEDDRVARVPRKSVLKPPRPSIGDACSIEWSDGVEYTATVLAMGKSLFTCYMFTCLPILHVYGCMRLCTCS